MGVWVEVDVVVADGADLEHGLDDVVCCFSVETVELAGEAVGNGVHGTDRCTCMGWGDTHGVSTNVSLLFVFTMQKGW